MNTTISKAKSLNRLINSQGIVSTYEPVGNANCHIDEIVDLGKDVHIQVCDEKPTYNIFTYVNNGNSPPEYVYHTDSQLDIIKYLKEVLTQKTIEQ